MSIGNRIIMSGILLLTATVSSAMEKQLEDSQGLKKSRALAITKPLPDPGLSSYLYGCVSGSFDSLSNTIANTVSDYSAFKKLGWPTSDEFAQQESVKCDAMYTRVNDSIQKQISYPTFLEDCAAITRRSAICQRVLLVLDSYPDALNLALFCIQYHRRVMNEFDLSRFLAFVNKEQEKSTKGAQGVYKELSKVMVLPNDNELLNRFVKQSISNKEIEEPKKDEDKKEQKKNGKK